MKSKVMGCCAISLTCIWILALLASGSKQAALRQRERLGKHTKGG